MAEIPTPVVMRRVVKAAGCAALVGLTALSAILAKEAGMAPPLTKVSAAHPAGAGQAETIEVSEARPVVVDPLVEVEEIDPAGLPEGARVYPDGTRFFNGRPVRPVRTIRMKVTAYSPDAASCGDSADGITATLHHVTTNAHKLVAADPRVLGYGSMISIPGYDAGRVVPVLDCGGAIKGNRLDVLFPTHEQARRWGVRMIDVVVWGYADGKPKDNPRKLRW